MGLRDRTGPTSFRATTLNIFLPPLAGGGCLPASNGVGSPPVLCDRGYQTLSARPEDIKKPGLLWLRPRSDASNPLSTSAAANARVVKSCATVRIVAPLVYVGSVTVAPALAKPPPLPGAVRNQPGERPASGPPAILPAPPPVCISSSIAHLPSLRAKQNRLPQAIIDLSKVAGCATSSVCPLSSHLRGKVPSFYPFL